MKRRQINIPKLLIRDVGRVIVAATLGRAIPGKMFHARQNVIRTAERIALKAAHLGLSHARTEVRIFAGAFHDPPPPRISRDVHHRREGPSNANRTGLSRRHALCMLRYGRIPRRSERERDGIDRAKTMNHVEAKDKWNMQASLFDRNMLKPVDLDRICNKKKRARLPLQHALIVRDRVWFLPGGLRYLAELLLQSHLAQQIADKPRSLGVVCSCCGERD